MLSLRDIRFHYPQGDFTLAVEKLGVSASAPLLILGPSGGGKTTLLRLMSGLVSPSQGTVRWGERELKALGEAERREFRLRQMGLVFQDFALLDYLTVGENILLPARFMGQDKALLPRARELAEHLDIGRFWQRSVAHLSQGERQRVALARALVHRPAYLFADEPTASLDAARGRLVTDLLLEAATQSGTVLVVVTHDPALLSRFSNHLRMEDLQCK